MMAQTKTERRAAWKKRTTKTATALRDAKAIVTRSGQRSIPTSARTSAEIRVAAWRKANPKRTIVDVSGRHTRVHTGIQSLTRPEQQQYMTLFTDYAAGKQIAQQRAQQLYNLSQKMKASERRRIEQKQPEQRVKRIALPGEKTVASKFFKRKDISPKALKKEKKKVQAWQKKDFPKWVTDFLGDPAKLSGKDRKLVLPFFGKTTADALKQKQAMTYFSNNVYKDVKHNPAKAGFFFIIGKYSNIGGKVLQAKGVKKLIKQIPKGELVSKRTLQAVSYALGAVYTHDIYKRVTESVLTGYKDGKTTSTEKKLQNGDIEITTSTKQIPQYRKPTGLEQHTRMGGIFATELLPLHIGVKSVDRGVKTGFKPEPKTQPKVKVTKKIKRAGRIIKTKTKEFKKTQTAEFKNFIAAEKAQVVLVKPKVKVKTKAKAKQKAKPKVKTINLMKDPKAMSQLTRAKTSMSSVNRIASHKQIYRVQQTQKLAAQAKQHQQIVAQKQAIINSRAAASQKKIQATIDKIKAKMIEGQDVKLLKSQLLKLKADAASKQKAEIEVLLKQIDAYIAAEAKAATMTATRQLAKLKLESKTVTTQKQKVSLINKSKTLMKQQVKLKSVLLLYSGQSQKPIQKQKIKTVITLISKQISNIKATQKEIQNVKVKPALRVPTKKLPVSKKVPARRTPPRRPVKKPVVAPVMVPVIPVIPLPRKAKATKKKKKTELQYVSWFVNNQIPTLKTLYGL